MKEFDSLYLIDWFDLIKLMNQFALIYCQWILIIIPSLIENSKHTRSATQYITFHTIQLNF